MRTEFSNEQLSDPGVQAMEKILRKCVHCGFCNATCPTFQLTGDELDGQLGAIILLTEMGDGDPRRAPFAAGTKQRRGFII